MKQQTEGRILVSLFYEATKRTQDTTTQDTTKQVGRQADRDGDRERQTEGQRLTDRQTV